MYESFFGLRKRPYAAAPDADVLVESPGVADAIGRLDRCVRQGRGIAVLTAAAGMGKTHLCHCLARRWEPEFLAIVLPNAGFSTRRGVLQGILAELGRPYQKLGETELRLELTAAARAVRERSRGAVLLFDEAHRHSERVLEEIRLLANLVENGEPLVRVVLAGQSELEEKLAETAYAALNERVGELVTLPRLTTEESRRYLRERAEFSGGSLETLFDPAAISIIVQACGGVPRCLNQLADHGLLLGYVAERRPVDEPLIREALDDLKRLPLHWHDPLPQAESGDVVEARHRQLEPDEPPRFDDVIEIGGIDDHDEDRSGPTGEDVPLSGAVAQYRSENGRNASDSSAEAARAARAATEAIRDRFARLDADDARRRWVDLIEQNGVRMERNGVEFAPQLAEVETRPRPATRPDANPLEILDRIEPLIAEALLEGSRLESLTSSSAAQGARSMLAEPSPATVAVEMFDTRAAAPVAAENVSARPSGRHSMLFSQLRRRNSVEG